jgi:hypothetical protein
VIRPLLLLAGLTAGVLAFVNSGAQAAGPPQTLALVLHHNAAATERLPHYLAAAPIAVRVGGYARRLHAVTVVAHGPNGEAITAPLARIGDAFAGDLHLLAPGSWTVAFSTELGSVPAALANVPLQVVTEDSADLAARSAFALAALSIVLGLTLVLRRHGRPLLFAATRRGPYET